MRILKGYWRTICQYLETPKGRYDFWDDLRAMLWIGLTVLAVCLFLKYFL